MLRFRERCSNDVTVNLVDMLAIIRPCRPTCHYTCQSGRRALNDAPCSLTGPPRLLPAFPRQISIGVRRRFRCQATLQITWLAVTVKRPGSQVNLSDASRRRLLCASTGSIIHARTCSVARSRLIAKRTRHARGDRGSPTRPFASLGSLP